MMELSTAGRSVMPRSLAAIVLVSLFALGACERPQQQTGSATRTITDPAMKAAAEQGRATFSDFLRAYASPEPGWGNFQVRHAFTNEAGFDDTIWLDLRSIGEGGQLHCTVPEDEDERAIQFEPGEELTVAQGSINDWLFIDQRGTFVGGYTLRVTMDRIGDTSGDTEDDMHGGIRFRDLEDLKPGTPTDP